MPLVILWEPTEISTAQRDVFGVECREQGLGLYVPRFWEGFTPLSAIPGCGLSPRRRLIKCCNSLIIDSFEIARRFIEEQTFDK
jgi:hypothetical protein